LKKGGQRSAFENNDRNLKWRRWGQWGLEQGKLICPLVRDRNKQAYRKNKKGYLDWKDGFPIGVLACLNSLIESTSHDKSSRRS
jgi:hypothetical protein